MVVAFVVGEPNPDAEGDVTVLYFCRVLGCPEPCRTAKTTAVLQQGFYADSHFDSHVV